MTEPRPHRIFSIAFAAVYPLYLEKVDKKGRSKAELDAVIAWHTGFDAEELDRHLAARTKISEFLRRRGSTPTP